MKHLSILTASLLISTKLLAAGPSVDQINQLARSFRQETEKTAAQDPNAAARVERIGVFFTSLASKMAELEADPAALAAARQIFVSRIDAEQADVVQRFGEEVLAADDGKEDAECLHVWSRVAFNLERADAQKASSFQCAASTPKMVGSCRAAFSRFSTLFNGGKRMFPEPRQLMEAIGDQGGVWADFFAFLEPELVFGLIEEIEAAATQRYSEDPRENNTPLKLWFGGENSDAFLSFMRAIIRVAEARREMRALL